MVRWLPICLYTIVSCHDLRAGVRVLNADAGKFRAGFRFSRVCQLPTERERTEAGCYSYHKMRAEPQKGSAPFPASGASHSPRAQLPWA